MPGAPFFLPVTSPEHLAADFKALYESEPSIFRAPGRVNLIGEHTDYNQGLVMPAAIDFFTYVAVAPRADRTLRLRSGDFPDEAVLDLEDAPVRPRDHWSDYAFGVAIKIEEGGRRLKGADMLVQSEVPIGSGLSSSAALEVAVGLALLENAGQSLRPMELAQTCQRSENEFIGIRSGLMDQFIACFGKADHAVMLDCRSLESSALPLPTDVKLVACNTMVKHQLAASEYNVRRAECEEGVKLLSEELPGINSLRDVSISDLLRLSHKLPEKIFARCRHVTTEIARVDEACVALRHEDLKKFGRLMYESHASLRNDYEVSCHELDLMVEFASHAEGCIGARMTGGGFGGCTINLVEAEYVDKFKEVVSTQYAEATGHEPEIYVCSAAEAASRVA